VENYEKIWANAFNSDVPEWLHKMKDEKFHYFVQYRKLAKDIAADDVAELNLFVNVFFEKSKVKIDKIKPLNEILYSDLGGQSIEWINARQKIFNLSNLDCKSKSESNYIKDVMQLNQITGMTHDSKTITVNEYHELINIAEEKIRHSKKHGKV
jgi:hypothetical protein